MNDDNDNPLLSIQDLEHFIRSNGIEAADDAQRIEDIETTSRLREECEFQTAVHRSIFGQDEKEGTRDENRLGFLEKCKGRKIIIKTADGDIENVPLSPLVESCDVVYTKASSKHWFSNSAEKLEISLEHFDASSVREFLAVLSKGRSAVDQIPADHIVECCRIAHYLQSYDILDDIVQILQDSIDSDNCASICSLADQLQIPSLYESSASHMIGTLNDIRDHELWDDFPKTLQNTLLTMRNAVRSSIMGRGQKTRVFFTSSDEFLAIFADNVRDQKERLREAKLRQEEIIQERSVRGGRHKPVMSGSVKDAAIKIAKQEKRLQTLEAFYREQKAIFASNEFSSNENVSNLYFSL